MAVVQVPVLPWNPPTMTGTQVPGSNSVQALQQHVLFLQQQLQQQQAALRQLSPTQDFQQNTQLQKLQGSQELQQLQPAVQHPQRLQHWWQLQHSQQQHPQQHPQQHLLQQQQQHQQQQHQQQQQQRPCMQHKSQHEQLRYHEEHQANHREVKVHHQSHQQKQLGLQLSQPPSSLGKRQSDDPGQPEWSNALSSGHFEQSYDWVSPEHSPRYWQTTSKPGSMTVGSNDALPELNSQQTQSSLAKPYTDVVAHPSPSQHEDHMTVMIRNIPARFTKAQLLRDFDAHGPSGIDYFFQPVDLQTGKTKGMAFVNFRSKAQAAKFQDQWHRQRLPNHGRGKVLDITAAHVLGITANLAQFTDHTLGSLCKHDALPVVIDEFGRLGFA
ncbi:unnamed protein product [Polarella glacialis]|uniref:RRM domain-containing protein n=1 Tax=Polarella glacialis TaxID=89957 RepID=A0A813EVY3_POLGL|nr:unnamed protein product [Polarella glacialis]